MDDLAQFSPRRRPWRPNGEPSPGPTIDPVQFKPVPPVALPERQPSYEWLPRLGLVR